MAESHRQDASRSPQARPDQLSNTHDVASRPRTYRHRARCPSCAGGGPPGHILAVAVVVVAEDGHDHDEGADDDGEVERAREEGRVE